MPLNSFYRCWYSFIGPFLFERYAARATWTLSEMQVPPTACTCTIRNIIGWSKLWACLFSEENESCPYGTPFKTAHCLFKAVKQKDSSKLLSDCWLCDQIFRLCGCFLFKRILKNAHSLRWHCAGFPATEAVEGKNLQVHTAALFLRNVCALTSQNVFVVQRTPGGGRKQNRPC